MKMSKDAKIIVGTLRGTLAAFKKNITLYLPGGAEFHSPPGKRCTAREKAVEKFSKLVKKAVDESCTSPSERPDRGLYHVSWMRP